MKALRYFFSILLLSLLPGISFAASYDTSFEFSTIETPHFQIHYHGSLAGLAGRAALIAEEAHDRLGRYYRWMPAEKTQIIIADRTDFAAGQVYPVPYSTIYINPGISALDDTIGEYDDWLRALIVHEYTHVVTFDETRGPFSAMRRLFGKPVPFADPVGSIVFLLSSSPNLFTPRWWFEGIATWTETEFSSSGRGRGAYYDMIFRSAVAEDNLLSIDRIGGEVPYWPAPGAQYIYGMRLHKYISEKYGPEAPAGLSERHAERFPYFLNGAPEEMYKGDNYIKLYGEMIEDVKKEEKEKIAKLAAVPFTELKLIAADGEKLSYPRWSPDGAMIAYTMADPHGHGRIIIRRAGKDGENNAAAGPIIDSIRKRYSDKALTWSPDSSKLYFSQYELYNGYDIYGDLYSYDVKSKTAEQLTKGLRITSPDVAPDGRSFAVVTQESGSSNIAILIFDNDKPILKKITDYKWERVTSPRWSPGGGHIAYARKQNNGRSGIYVFDLKEGNSKAIAEGAVDFEYPTWSRDGKNIIYVSDETGVFNLFSYSIEDGRARQVSHLPGGAFYPDVAPGNKTIAFSNYSSRGFSISSLGFSPEQDLKSPVIKPYWKDSGAEVVEAGLLSNENADGSTNAGTDAGKDAPGEVKKGVIEKAKPYSALDTLFPRFWLPTSTIAGAENLVGAYTLAQDALAYHTYSIALNFAPGPRKLFFDAYYQLDYFYPVFAIEALSRPVFYSELIGTRDYFERESQLNLSMTLPVKRLERRFAFTFGYQLKGQSAYKSGVPSVASGPAVFEGRRDNLFVKAEADTALRYPYSISREEGARFSLTYRDYFRAIGSDIEGREAIASIEKFTRLPFINERSHEVIYINMRGGASNGTATAQQAFQVGGIPAASEFPVRGVSSRLVRDKYAATASAELRIPLADIFSGWDTKPFYFDKLHSAIFVDAGQAWGDKAKFNLSNNHAGVGVEVRLDMTLGYQLSFVPTIGVAKGIGKGDKGGAAYLTVNTLY